MELLCSLLLNYILAFKLVKFCVKQNQALEVVTIHSFNEELADLSLIFKLCLFLRLFLSTLCLFAHFNTLTLSTHCLNIPICNTYIGYVETIAMCF